MTVGILKTYRLCKFNPKPGHANEGSVEVPDRLLSGLRGFIPHIADAAVRNELGVGYRVCTREVLLKFILLDIWRQTPNEYS